MATPISSLYSFLAICFLFQGRLCSEVTQTSESQRHDTHFVQLASLLPKTTCSSSTQGSNEGTTLEVIHKHGPCSPLGQDRSAAPNHTSILLQDQTRVSHIHSSLRGKKYGAYDLKALTVPVNPGKSVGIGDYVVTVGLGTPKNDLTLIFDTGSDLTWTQCQPCLRYCYDQQDQKFDPSKSTSFGSIACNAPSCTQLESSAGIDRDCSSSKCVYGIQYGDQSYSVGFFSQEKLTLGSTDVFNNFFFGCGQNNRGIFGGAAGLLGLGRDKISLVEQTANKYGKMFSYCLPATSSTTGYLTFGGKTGSSSVKYTPLATLEEGPSFYGLDIVGISVGNNKLPIAKKVFSTSRAIIDSGTVITRLPPAAYSAMRTAFQERMKNYPKTDGFSILDTCYDLSGYRAVRLPQISFYFNGGLKLQLDASGIMYTVSQSQVCLAFTGNDDESSVTIFGNTQQKTLLVVHDVVGKKIGFGPRGCR